ncbi:MAG: aminotransferase class V-fold PLP-dependent enzyme [Spirochaetes bacterium]|nr:aminotransferase class V-fold PLP-dependent enzyme [Spirochaetota bacterium]
MGEGNGRYFDDAGSAPPFPEALQAQREASERFFGNPSASHPAGRAAKKELERLKGAFLDCLGAVGSRLLLTSGATEGNNQVLRAFDSGASGGRILMAADVHDSVWNAVDAPRREILPLEPDGGIRPGALAEAIGKKTRLLCLSHAAHETGRIHDAGALVAQARGRNVPVLVDGSQALGRIPVDLGGIGCEAYTWSAHKFGGPRGVGGILLAGGRLGPLFFGGSQEYGMRAGTENLPGLAGALCALQLSLANLSGEAARLRALSQSFLGNLRRLNVGFRQNGAPNGVLPGLLSLSFEGVDGRALVADLGQRGFHVASGAACRSDRPEASRVLLAMGREEGLARGTLRISFGAANSEDDVAALAQALADSLARLRLG